VVWWVCSTLITINLFPISFSLCLEAHPMYHVVPPGRPYVGYTQLRRYPSNEDRAKISSAYQLALGFEFPRLLPHVHT
jgi:hypothetical protein